MKGVKDPVDRTSARVHAVVSLYAPSDFRGAPPSPNVRALLGPLIEKEGEEKALAEASPVMHITGEEPPFLLIHGDKDDAVPLVQSTHLQAALKNAGVRCDLIIIPGGPHATSRWHTIPGVPDWEREMTAWLNTALEWNGPIGEGIRRRQFAPASAGQAPAGN
jgi:dipeptidyl aminopeptidase/acylaminoacyl peptidase